MPNNAIPITRSLSSAYVQSGPIPSSGAPGPGARGPGEVGSNPSDGVQAQARTSHPTAPIDVGDFADLPATEAPTSANGPDALSPSVELYRKADQAGVNLARRDFWRKCATSTVLALGLAATVALTVLTAGGALAIAGSAVLGLYALKSAGDTHYARMHWRNEQAALAGDHSHTPLPMGSDMIGNWTYQVLRNRQQATELTPEADAQLKGKAGRISMAIDVSLGLTLTVLTGLSAGHLLPSLAGPVLKVALMGYVRKYEARTDMLPTIEQHKSQHTDLERLAHEARVLRQASTEQEHVNHEFVRAIDAHLEKIEAAREGLDRLASQLAQTLPGTVRNVVTVGADVAAESGAMVGDMCLAATTATTDGFAHVMPGAMALRTVGAAIDAHRHGDRAQALRAAVSNNAQRIDRLKETAAQLAQGDQSSPWLLEQQRFAAAERERMRVQVDPISDQWQQLNRDLVADH